MGRGTGKILAMLLWSTMMPITCAWAQHDDSGIWGEAIMAQPFDTMPFRAVKIPEWVQETTGCGYTLSVLDSAGRARAAAHGVTISEMGFVDPLFAYYDSKLLKQRNPAVSPARLERYIAEYKRLCVRVLGVYPLHLEPEGIDLKAQPSARHQPCSVRLRRNLVADPPRLARGDGADVHRSATRVAR